MPDYDFGELLGVLSAHPRLMRILGLVIDLEVQAAHWRPAADGDHAARGRWTPTFTGETKVVLPKTTCRIDTSNRIFRLEPKVAGALERGHLPVGGSEFDLVTIDPDGAGLKALNFATTIKAPSRLPKHKTLDTPKRTGPPTLRSAGLPSCAPSARQRSRESSIADKALDGLVLGAAAPPDVVDPTVQPTLYNEDVTPATTVDIWSRETSSGIRSSAATGAYTLPGGR